MARRPISISLCRVASSQTQRCMTRLIAANGSMVRNIDASKVLVQRTVCNQLLNAPTPRTDLVHRGYLWNTANWSIAYLLISDSHESWPSSYRLTPAVERTISEWVRRFLRFLNSPAPTHNFDERKSPKYVSVFHPLFPCSACHPQSPRRKRRAYLFSGSLPDILAGPLGIQRHRGGEKQRDVRRL